MSDATDEEYTAFKRGEHEAMRRIVAGDLICPDPSAHDRMAALEAGLRAAADEAGWLRLEDALALLASASSEAEVPAALPANDGPWNGNRTEVPPVSEAKR